MGVALGGAVGGGIAKRAGGARRAKTYTLPMFDPSNTYLGEASRQRRRTREPVTARTASASMRRWDAWKEKGGGRASVAGAVRIPDVPDTRGTRGPSRVE